MELNEGIKFRGRPFEIPDCSRNDLPTFFKDRGFKVGVEIGVFKGDYTEVLAKSGLEVYGVDPWKDYKGYIYSQGQRWLDKQYEKTRQKLSIYPNVTLLRKTSMEAVEDFGEESLDFVYIDGNHRFKYIAEDLWEWQLRVKTGGVIAGHDYAYFKHRYVGGGCQVREIVDAFAKSFELDFWVLGKYKDKVRDRFRSWMFIKTWKNQ